MCSRKRHGSIDLDDDRKHHSANGLQNAGFPSAESAALLAPRMVLNMYEQRFGLHRKPFQTVTKTQDFFVSSSFNELLPSVVHALQTDLGVAVLTGPAGVGKSVSLEQIQRNLESTAQTLLLRGGSVKGSADLLYLLHRRLLKLQPDGAAVHDSSATEIVRRYEVVERLERVASFWGPLTILLDDAQLVNQDVFSELRSLLEEGHDGRRFARLLIAGPLLLEEVLADSANSHFARKIRTHSFLQPLRSDESIQYLGHHFSLAGGQLNEAFAADALELIAAAADGVPQCLNLLADESLMVCEEADCNKVTRDFVTQALTRLQHLPYSWNVSLVAETADDNYDDEEFGGSAVTSVSDNSIEIGEFPSDTFSDSSRQSMTSMATEGVFEIGAPQPVVEAAVIEVVQAEELADFGNDSVGQAESLLVTSELPTEEVQYVEIETTLPETTPSASGLEDAIEISQAEFETLGNEIQDDSNVASSSQLLTSDRSADISGLAEFVDGEDEDGNSVPAVSGTDAAPDPVSSYEPWAPAGEWPTAPLEIDAANLSESSVVEVSQLATTEAAETESACEHQGVEAQAAESALVEPVWDNAATPVVDRFTWAELGRTSNGDNLETAESVHDLTDHDTTLQFAAAWPPVTAGVAPVSQIPVTELDDEYAELLNDLGLLIDATAERRVDHDLASTEQRTVDSADIAVASTELLASSKGPEGTIEELQQLIQEEQQLDQIVGSADGFPQMQSQDDSPVPNSATSDSPAELSFSDSHAPMASPRFFSMSQAEIDEVDDSVGDAPESNASKSNSSSFDVPPNDGTGYTDEYDPDVVAFQQVVEERDEWLEQQDLLAQIVGDEQADQGQAIPSALRQARRQQRRSVLTMGFRQAAGAETVPDVPVRPAESGARNSGEPTETSHQDHPISLPMPEATGTVADSESMGSEKAGFSNLFTRLRRRRGKAS